MLAVLASLGFAFATELWAMIMMRVVFGLGLEVLLVAGSLLIVWFLPSTFSCSPLCSSSASPYPHSTLFAPSPSFPSLIYKNIGGMVQEQQILRSGIRVG